MFRTLAVLATLATASALVQPAIKPSVKLPAAAESALALRGGGAVDGDLFVKILSGFFGTYAVGFVLAPETLMEQNFVFTPDKYHAFFGRSLGTVLCVTTYLLNQLEGEAKVKAALAFACAVALTGPGYAQLFLETTPMHLVGIGGTLANGRRYLDVPQAKDFKYSQKKFLLPKESRTGKVNLIIS